MGHENLASPTLLTSDDPGAGAREPISQANYESPTQPTIDGVRVFRPDIRAGHPPTSPGDEGGNDYEIYPITEANEIMQP